LQFCSHKKTVFAEFFSFLRVKAALFRNDGQARRALFARLAAQDEICGLILRGLWGKVGILGCLGSLLQSLRFGEAGQRKGADKTIYRFNASIRYKRSVTTDRRMGWHGQWNCAGRIK